MYKKLILCLIIGLGLSATGQSIQTDSLGFQTFEMNEGDTTYLMKKYFLVLLKADTARNQSPEELVELQKGHMEHMNTLAEQGYIDMAGPMGEDTELRGILVMRVPTLEQAQTLCDQDPAVKAHRLKAEIHPWWAAVGSRLK